MQEGRKKALSLLEANLESADKQVREKRLAEGQRLAARFKLDESQREFELGESIYFSNKNGAMEHYDLASQLEADNTQVHFAKLRYYLKSGSCSSANKQLKAAKEIWSHSSLIEYYQIRMNLCEGESLDLEKVKNISDSKELAPYKKRLLIQALVEKGHGQEALKVATDLSTIEVSYSEIYYWLFRAGDLEDGGSLAHLRKYLKLCQSYGGVERRIFKLEPLLCDKEEEVRKLLQKRESGGV